MPCPTDVDQIDIPQSSLRLTVWLTDQPREHACEETGEEVVPVKDSQGPSSVSRS